MICVNSHINFKYPLITISTPISRESVQLQFLKIENLLHHEKIPNLHEKSLTSSIDLLGLGPPYSSNAMLPQVDSIVSKKERKTERAADIALDDCLEM